MLAKISFDAIENIENALTQWYNCLETLVEMVLIDPTGVGRFGPLIQSTINLVTKPVGDAMIVLCFFIGIYKLAV